MNISVLVCTYGSVEWAEVAYRAVESAQDQGALEVLHEHSTGGTLADVRNAAARRARGDWLCFLDADDELAPGYLEAIARARYVSPVPAVFVPAVQYVIERAGYEVARRPPVHLNTGRPLSVLNYAVIGSVLPTRLFLEVGGFRELPAWEDWDLWLRCERAGASFVDVPEAVYIARHRKGSRNDLSSDLGRKLYAQIRADYGYT